MAQEGVHGETPYLYRLREAKIVCAEIHLSSVGALSAAGLSK